MGDNKPTPVERQIRLEQGKIAAVLGGVAAAAAAGQRYFNPEWTRRDAVSIGSVAARSALQFYQEYQQGETPKGAELRRAAFTVLLLVAQKTVVTPVTQRISQRDRTLGAAAGLAFAGATGLLGTYLARSEDRLAQLEQSGS